MRLPSYHAKEKSAECWVHGGRPRRNRRLCAMCAVVSPTGSSQNNPSTACPRFNTTTITAVCLNTLANPSPPSAKPSTPWQLFYPSLFRYETSIAHTRSANTISTLPLAVDAPLTPLPRRTTCRSFHLEVVVQQLRAALPLCPLRARAQGSRVGSFHRRDTLVCARNSRMADRRKQAREKTSRTLSVCVAEPKLYLVPKRTQPTQPQRRDVIRRIKNLHARSGCTHNQRDKQKQQKKGFSTFGEGSGAAKIKGAPHSSTRSSNNNNNDRSARENLLKHAGL